MTTATLIESKDVTRDYGFDGTIAVIDHPRHGRLLIQDGFGGIYTPAGGCVRWRHGQVNRLLPGDTLAALDTVVNEYGTTRFDLVDMGYDKDRPYLRWSGSAIEALAKAVGL